MSKWRTLTVEPLKAIGACSDQVALFREHFGESVRVTESRAAKVASLFDWDWAARNLLSAPAWAEYERVVAPAWAEYERVAAAAWAVAYINDREGA